MKLTTKQVMQIAAEAGADPRTVVKIYNGAASRKLVRERVVEAAKKLKIVSPPSSTESGYGA